MTMERIYFSAVFKNNTKISFHLDNAVNNKTIVYKNFDHCSVWKVLLIVPRVIAVTAAGVLCCLECFSDVKKSFNNIHKLHEILPVEMMQDYQSLLATRLNRNLTFLFSRLKTFCASQIHFSCSV